jgi:predicted metal-dependent enzyme (double-stranded beta helix superfamily)
MLGLHTYIRLWTKAWRLSVFNKPQFVEDIQAAMVETDAQGAIHEVIQRAVSDPGAVIKALGAPGRGRSEQLFHDETLTITNVIWGSQMWVPPHDHTMWAVNGVYQGQEDNMFWREEEFGLVQHGGFALTTGDVRKLGENAIHSVKNPSAVQLCGAIHVYGGDFFGAIPRRHSWDADSLQRGPYDYEFINSLRDQSNERMDALIEKGVAVA